MTEGARRGMRLPQRVRGARRRDQPVLDQHRAAAVVAHCLTEVSCDGIGGEDEGLAEKK